MSAARFLRRRLTVTRKDIVKMARGIRRMLDDTSTLPAKKFAGTFDPTEWSRYDSISYAKYQLTHLPAGLVPAAIRLGELRMLVSWLEVGGNGITKVTEAEIGALY